VKMASFDPEQERTHLAKATSFDLELETHLAKATSFDLELERTHPAKETSPDPERERTHFVKVGLVQERTHP